MNALAGLDRSSSELLRRARAHDASHYLLRPAEVAVPSSTGHVVALFEEMHRTRRHLTFRGGGTSLSGQAVTDDLLVDVRRDFRGVRVLDGGERVQVGAGETLRHVNAVLARHGRRLGPDPGSEVAATIGGIIANNASGMLCGNRDNTYATLESLVFVLPSGRVINTADSAADITLRLNEAHLVNGLLMLRRRIRGNPGTEAEVRRQFSIKNTMGYGVNALLDFHRPVDIARHLLVGSEGTLAFIAEATFRTVPLKRFAATGLALFSSLEEAAEAVPALEAAGFDGIELLDATALKLAQRTPEAPALLRNLEVLDHTALLLELQDRTDDALAERVAVASEVVAGLPLVEPLALTTDPDVRGRLWRIRRGLYAIVSGNRPPDSRALLQDLCVPLTALASTCRGLRRLFAKHGYDDAVVFGHARDGSLNFMLTEQLGDPTSLRRFRRFTRELVRLVLGAGGSLKAAHGTGRAMAPFVANQFGDELYQIMREIKSLFDPAGILNPGVIISNDRDIHTRHLKTTPQVEPEVDRCVECGYCEPVCPSRDLTLTPRQRIVLRRELAADPDDAALAREVEESYDYANNDTCAVDGMCSVECPLGINTGDLVRRLRAEQVGRFEAMTWTTAARTWRGLPRLGGAALTTAKHTGPLAGVFASVGRRVLGEDNVPALDRGLPSGGRRIRRRASRRGVKREDAVAMYFPACVHQTFGSRGQGVYHALDELCERADVAVRLLNAEGLCCGRPWWSRGLTQGHETMRAKVRRRLARQGATTIICDSSGCTQGLIELTAGMGGVEVVDVLEFVATTLLPRLRVTGQFDSIALHPTCSTRQLGLDDAMLEIARAISPDVDVPTAWNCCGFAGDRGLLHPELTASATAAEAAEVRAGTHAAHASADRTCEIGMSRATGYEYVHVVELLAAATRPWGQAPERPS